MSSKEYHDNVKFPAHKDEHQSLRDVNNYNEGLVYQCDSFICDLKDGDLIQLVDEHKNEPSSDYDSHGHRYQTDEILHVHRNYNDDGNVDAVEATRLFKGLKISNQHASESLAEEAAFKNEPQYQVTYVEQEDRNKDNDFAHKAPSKNNDSSSEAQHEEANVPITFESHNEDNKMEENNADMSVQMYRYLQHNYLKRQIEDISKRENTFASRHFWDEALRLKEMRNELILLKNKNLYENIDLRMNDFSRRVGLNNVEAREKLIKKRRRVCDTMLYSDEAKDMWDQWSQEEEELAQTEGNALRDLILDELENEWKNLALRDKNLMSELKSRIMIEPEMSEEDKLVAIINNGYNRWSCT